MNVIFSLVLNNVKVPCSCIAVGNPIVGYPSTGKQLKLDISMPDGVGATTAVSKSTMEIVMDKLASLGRGLRWFRCSLAFNLQSLLMHHWLGSYKALSYSFPGIYRPTFSAGRFSTLLLTEVLSVPPSHSWSTSKWFKISKHIMRHTI